MTTERKCDQCTYFVPVTATEVRQCKRMTCKYGPMCWQHTKKVEGVEVKESGIRGAGLGLFATRVFEAGQYISKYGGEVVNMAELNRRYGKNATAPYAMDIPGRGRFVDAIYSNSGNARYANDCFNSTFRCNAELVRRADARERLRATTRINIGDEILVSYGDEYWLPTGND